MSSFLAGLPDLPALRQTIAETLKGANLLGTYTFPDGEIEDAIAVEGLGHDEGEESYPPAGTQVSGLEVVIIPAEDMPIQSLLDGYMQTYRHAIVLKQWSNGENKSLRAFHLLKQVLGNIFDGSVIRQLPNPRLDSIETISFSLEQVVYVEFDDDLDQFPEAPPLQPVAPINAVETDTATLIGQPLYLKLSGKADLAIANSYTTARVVGLATEAVTAHTSVRYEPDATVSRDDWTPITGTAALLPGAIYYLDPLQAGTLTTIAPTETGQVVAKVGIALSTTTLSVEIEPPILL